MMALYKTEVSFVVWCTENVESLFRKLQIIHYSLTHQWEWKTQHMTKLCVQSVICQYRSCVHQSLQSLRRYSI